MQVNTFAELTQLRWLDLSDNRLHDIPDGAFDGLTLQHLFLNGNRAVRLRAGSFSGLVTSGLYLHDCALRALLPATLAPLNGTLVNLWLNGNRLTGVDRRLAPVFSQLSHLRLGANPLHCGCESLWLKRLYDRHGGATFRGAEPPTCWTPTRLRARHFDQLGAADLHCAAPSFGNVDAELDWRGSGRLRCTAVGQPAPTLYWVRPSGRTRRYDVERPGAERNEAVVAVSRADSSQSAGGLYMCVAQNDVGNVTLTVNVSWPPPPASGTSLQPPPRPPTARSTARPLPGARPAHTARSPTRRLTVIGADYQLAAPAVDETGGEAVRLFSVAELVSAVLATHLCTVLAFAVVLLPVVLVRARRRARRRHAAATDHPRACDALLASKPATAARCTATTSPHGTTARCTGITSRTGTSQRTAAVTTAARCTATTSPPGTTARCTGSTSSRTGTSQRTAAVRSHYCTPVHSCADYDIT